MLVALIAALVLLVVLNLKLLERSAISTSYSY